MGLFLFRICIFISLITFQGLSGIANWEKEFKKKVRRNEAPEWMLRQIRSDLQPFSNQGFSLKRLNGLMGLSFELVRYKIVNNHVEVTFAKQMENHPHIHVIKNFLIRLTQLAKLPDVEMVMTMRDSFYHLPVLVNNAGPIFSFAKRKGDKGIILFPDSESVTGNFPLLDEVNKGKCSFPWHQKVAKVFWRGATTGFVNNLDFMNRSTYLNYPRAKLVHLSLSNGDHVDARFSSVIHVDDKTKKMFEKKGFVGSPVSIHEHLKYKYQILVDGFTCAFSRAYWQLFSDCLIFKQESPDIQWYYADLKPYEHYIPVKEDFSDLIEKIEWARTHEEEVKKIIQQANQFAETHIKYEDIMLYVYLLIKEYAELQNF